MDTQALAQNSEINQMASKTLSKPKKLPTNPRNNISYQRTCNCGPTHINCLTAKEWIKNQLGVWRFGLRAEIFETRIFILQRSLFLLLKNVSNYFLTKGN